jgi:hypothetical protein
MTMASHDQDDDRQRLRNRGLHHQDFAAPGRELATLGLEQD